VASFQGGHATPRPVRFRPLESRHASRRSPAQSPAGLQCASPVECPYSRLAGCDILGIGSGIYYGRIHEELLEWVHDLPETYGGKFPVFIFTTSGLPFLAKLWHRPLKKSLAGKGYEVIGEFACRGFDTWGPLRLTGGLNWRHPNERDLQRAREFAQRTRAAVSRPA
jgi:hypothetical protein